MEAEEESEVTPVIEDEGVSFCYIKHAQLYLLGITNRNCNVAMTILFLYRLVEVFKEYFEELEEESIRDNFVIIYELLDEMMDFGYPQATDSTILKEYITQEGHKLNEEVRPPQALTS